MANSPLAYDVAVKAAVDAVAALLNNGFLDIRSGSQPAVDGSATGTLLAHLTFGATAFGASTASGSGATATANSIGSDTSADNTGTAGYFLLLKSDGTTIVGTGSCGTSGADLNFNTTSIVAGATVSCSAFTITMPQS